MDKGQARLPYHPQATLLPSDPVHFLGVVKVGAPQRAKAAKAVASRCADAPPPVALPPDRRVTFLDIEVRE